MPKEQHASLFAVEAALHEAVRLFNASHLRAVEEMSAALNWKPAELALKRASEKDALRIKKATKCHRSRRETQGGSLCKKSAAKESGDYASGAF